MLKKSGIDTNAHFAKMIAQKEGALCMKGSIQYRKDRGVYYVAWYHAPHKKHYRIYTYNGEFLYHEKVAEKLLACMQADVEKGIFRIEKYTRELPTDVIPYLWKWLDTVSPTLKPGTYKDYYNSIKNHLEPFFQVNPVQLHEIQYDVLFQLLNSIKRVGKGKSNVMYCLHRCLTYAWRSGRIQAVPPFPERKQYGIVEPTIMWMPEDRQIAVIEAIEPEHQPVFWFLKYHLRRPSEACALYKEDYNPYIEGGVFTIRRTFSDKRLVNSTKTGDQHIIPCHDEFKLILKRMFEHHKKWGIISPFFFINPYGRKPGRYYTNVSMNRIWSRACRRVGEDIDLYSGLKHSSCSQYINQKGLSLSDLQVITDHARLDSVKRYAKVEVRRKKELMERKVTPISDTTRTRK